MSVGLSPKYTLDLPLEDLTSEQFLVLAIEAAKSLGWNVGHISYAGFVAYTEFSLRSSSEEFKVEINGSLASLKSECTGTQMVDWGKNKRNIEDFISTYNELKLTTGAAELAEKLEAIRPSLAPDSGQIHEAPVSAKGRLTGFAAIFRPAKGFFITPILIDINIAVFIIMAIAGVSVFAPDNEMLLNWGANFRPSVLDGQWWRLFTNFFLHAGIFHLLMNMYALLYIGILLEPHIGRARFLSAYLLSGIAASTASLWWHDLTVSVGASGAIFGMYGVFLALLTTNYIERAARKTLLTSIGVFVGYNLLNGLKGNIDNAAHIGGLISGLVIGYIYVGSLKAPRASNLRYVTIGIATIAVLGASIFVIAHTNNDINIYEAKMKTFAANEESALEVLRLPDSTPLQTKLSGFKTGLAYWQQNMDILNSMQSLKLPEEAVSRNQKLVEYCMLRINTYSLLCKEIEENTGKYDDQIKTYAQQTEKIIDELK